MSRVEENARMIEANMLNNVQVSYQEGVVLLLSTINTALFDISKSLAVIADSMSKRGEQDD